MHSPDKISAYSKRYTLNEICRLLVMPIRRARYYIQLGLVDRPHGVKRGAYYSPIHLRQLQHIQRWQEEGLSLDRIAQLKSQKMTPAQPPTAAIPHRGDIKLLSQIYIAPGVELNINQEQAQLSFEQTLDLYRQIGETVDRLQKQRE
jgi:DNA-binding transcriptional MerR regulator